MTTLTRIGATTSFPAGPIILSTFHSLGEIEKWANNKKAPEVWHYQQTSYKQETYLAAIRAIQTIGE
jgi:hypothetical protein